MPEETSPRRPPKDSIPAFAAPAALMDQRTQGPAPAPVPVADTVQLPTVEAPRRPGRNQSPASDPAPSDDRQPWRSLLGRDGHTRTGTSSERSATEVDLDVSRETSQDQPRRRRPADVDMQVSKETLIAAGAAAVALLAMGAGLVVRFRTKGQRRLRQPTDDQRKAVAKPLGSILARRVSLLRGQNAADLIDALTAIAGVGTWIEDGPLTEDAPGRPIPTPEEA
jgi:hypothetical protein